MKAASYLPCLAMVLTCSLAVEAQEIALQLTPASIELVGADVQQQLLVTARQGEREFDATETAKFASTNPAVARVSAEGIISPVADGTAQITAMYENRSATANVTVRLATARPVPHFTNDIIPLLTKSGCNSGGCHGKQSGRGGFKLSVFGHDAAADYDALVKEGRGRRLSLSAPSESLLLTKISLRTPHGGGMRLSEDSAGYRRLLRWVEAGVPFGSADVTTVVGIEIFPTTRTVAEHSGQQLLVTALLSDGTRRDVTHEALYSSNDETLATVDGQGRFKTTMLAGEAAIVARYQEHVASCRVTVPINKDLAVAAGLAAWDRSHFVDRHVADKWAQIHVLPSPPADDATFHRRIYLDLIGKLPTVDEVRTFLADKNPAKRVHLVDTLLARPEFADYWTLMWADLLRVNRDDLGPRAAQQYHAWIRSALAENRPYDQFLRELLTAQGSSERNSAVNFYRAFADPTTLSVSIGQVFLGVRLECAKCHHHPYEKWGQEDFYGMAAFFPRLQKKPGNAGELTFFVGDTGEVKHPRTQAVVSPQVLRGEPLVEVTSDPRSALADWMTAPDNQFVARALVNRIWAQLMGRGLVEPIDDLRDTNPATNEPLLAALVDDFVKHQFDVKHLIRTITTARVYGLSSQSNDTNARDMQNYSRAYRKRLGAEVLLDAVCDATGEPELFAGMPPGTRAVQLWDHRLPSPFLDTFGRPLRKTVCQCERQSEATLGQVLHLMNSTLVGDKITSPTARAARLAASEMPADEIVADLYLRCLGRMPGENERNSAREAFSANGATRRAAVEDIMWALVNSAEFVLNH